MSIRTYSELIALPTFEERYQYLRLDGRVGKETFGFDRWLNQRFYKDPEWRSIRDDVIIRDNSCDLGIEGRDIRSLIIVHHMNPITQEDILERRSILLDPENLICVTDRTHKAIHYGNEELLDKGPIVRTKNDTCPWKR